jgi:hypothetical protein
VWQGTKGEPGGEAIPSCAEGGRDRRIETITLAAIPNNYPKFSWTERFCCRSAGFRLRKTFRFHAPLHFRDLAVASLGLYGSLEDVLSRTHHVGELFEAPRAERP